MLAVDLSGSMEINDMELNGVAVDRLVVTKHVLTDFIERRKGDRLGLILFGTKAYLQAPLTFDLQTVGTLMDESAIGMAGNKTAIGDALGLAVKHLRNRPRESRVLILLTMALTRLVKSRLCRLPDWRQRKALKSIPSVWELKR